MKTATCEIFLLSLLLAVIGNTAEPAGKSDLQYLKEIPTGAYSLSLDRVELYQGELSKGLFTFKWGGSEPVKIWGIGYDDDGVFDVLFENTSLYEGETWTATNFGHCGTVSKLSEFQPGEEYTFRIAIWQFNGADGEKGLVSIGGDTVSLVSTPFAITTLQNAIADKTSISAPASAQAE